MDHFSSACNNFSLTISTKKTEVLYQPAPGKPYTEPTIFVNDQKLSAVDKFTYLGSTLSCAVHVDDEVNIRIVKVSAAFGHLHESVWDRPAWRRIFQEGAVLWEQEKLLCYVEEVAAQICQEGTCGCTSELYILPDWSREFQAQIGLFSHLHTHQNPT